MAGTAAVDTDDRGRNFHAGDATFGAVRVVAGSARGLRLVAPRGDAVRPTTDRVREAVFNALGSLRSIEGATVVDLFAGSGAMGIEALSRGAGRVTFVDRDRVSLDAVRANLAATGLGDRASVVRADAVDWLRSAAAVDLAIADPPYRFDGWPELFALVRADLLVVESDRLVEAPDGWEPVRDRRYGSTWVRVARRVPSGEPRPAPGANYRESTIDPPEQPA